jgi:hypothetical protein
VIYHSDRVVLVDVSLVEKGKQASVDGTFGGVKVLHPGIREKWALDLNLMNKAAVVVEFLFPSMQWINLRCCVREFSIAMARQVSKQIQLVLYFLHSPHYIVRLLYDRLLSLIKFVHLD